jgi:hypothetical protein
VPPNVRRPGLQGSPRRAVGGHSRIDVTCLGDLAGASYGSSRLQSPSMDEPMSLPQSGADRKRIHRRPRRGGSNHPNPRRSDWFPELRHSAASSLSSRPGPGNRRSGRLRRVRPPVQSCDRRRARRRLTGDAPRRLHLRDSPWDRSDGRDQSPLPVCLLLAGRILRGGCPRVIVGNDDSDYAVIPFVVQMVTLGHD